MCAVETEDELFGIWSQFQGPILAAALVAGVTVMAVALMAARRRAVRRRGPGAACRVLAVGAAVLVVVCTASPATWPPVLATDGDLVLGLGQGGLGEWRVLFEQPSSLAAVLLVANVLIYVPLGFFGRLGWRRSLPVLAGAAALSSAIEVVQWGGLGRVASTDDFLLNVGGAALGVLLAAVTAARAAPRRQPPVVVT